MSHDKPRGLSIDALFDEAGTGPNLSADPHQEFHAADLVFGVDRMRGREFLLYGADVLRDVIKNGESKSLYVIRIELDQDTDDLEQVIAFVTVVKGKHDNQATEGDL
jgi:hypothetical protein